MNNYQLGIRAVHQKDIKAGIIEAKRNKFDILEIHLSSPQFLPQGYTASQLNTIKDFAIKNGIILQTHSEIGQSLIQTDDILRKAEKQKLERMVRFSQGLGVRCLTLHPGKAPAYFTGPGKAIQNDNVYSKYYYNLFEDSLNHIISITSKDLSICIENTDNFNLGYQKVLATYLKSNQIFLTWDIMKSYSHGRVEKLREDQWKFLQKNIKYVRNIHISGPSHAGLQGYEKNYTRFFKLFQGKNIPMVIEIVSLKEAIRAKKMIRELGF
jgi:sugar phosphate isomerase/epimerase